MVGDSKERVGLLGGTFDPIHFGHLGLAVEAKKRLRLRSVSFVPAFISPHKSDLMSTDFLHRLNMTRAALENEPSFNLCEIEIKRGGMSYTIDTLEALLTEKNDVEYYFLLGIDAFLHFKTWKDWRRILELSNLFVANRPDIRMPRPEEILKMLFDGPTPYHPLSEKEDIFIRDDYKRCMAFSYSTSLNISSSAIRRLFLENRSTKNLLPPQVERYIIDNQIYQINSQPFKE